MSKYIKTFFVGILGICGLIIALTPMYLIYKRIFGEIFGWAFGAFFPFLAILTVCFFLITFTIGQLILTLIEIKNDQLI